MEGLPDASPPYRLSFTSLHSVHDDDGRRKSETSEEADIESKKEIGKEMPCVTNIRLHPFPTVPILPVVGWSLRVGMG